MATEFIADFDSINPKSRITLASIESLSMPLVQEIVVLADYRCLTCQKRVADIISRMNGETESVVVSLLEKKITLTHRIVVKETSKQFGAAYKRSNSKFAFVTRMFCSPKASINLSIFLNKYMSRPACYMVMRINLDCNACCRKMRRTILNMKEIETHLIEKQQCKASVYGRFRAADVAIKIRKKMKRRVEILEIQESDGGMMNGYIEQQEQQPPFMDHDPSSHHVH